MEFKEIHETYNLGDIAFLKSLLSENGIRFIIEGEHSAVMRPMTNTPIIIKVDKEQLQEADELLRDFKKKES